MIGKDVVVSSISIKPQEWEYEFQHRGGNTVLLNDFWTKVFLVEFDQAIKLKIPNVDYLFLADGRGFIKKSQKQEIMRKFSAEIKKETYIKYVYTTTVKRVEQFEGFSQRVLAKLSSVHRNDLIKEWVRFRDQFLMLIPWYWLPWYVTEYDLLAKQIKQGLERYRGRIERITDFDTALMLLIFPKKKAMFQQEQEAFSKLVAYAQRTPHFKKDKRFTQMTDAYLKRYYWITQYILVEKDFLDFTAVAKNVEDALSTGFMENRRKSVVERISDKQCTRALEDCIRKDIALMKKVDWAREFAWVLNWSVEKSFEVLARLHPLFEYWCAKMGIKYGQMLLLRANEIEQALANPSLLKKVNWRERSYAHAVLLEDGVARFMYGKRAKRWSEDMGRKIEDVKQGNECKGQIAHKGIVRGAVRVCHSAQESHMVLAGEILVCTMTTPEFLPAINRAAAIVADEGGLLSHAAIISRELHKPCIIGTKIATKILKDGDLVEVDAYRGMVRKVRQR